MRVLFASMSLSAAVVFVGVPVSAQSPTTDNPVSAGIRTAWEGAKRNLTRSAQQMPEGEYGFRPVETVRTFGQILAHLAGANYEFCSAAKGEKSPHAEAAFEKTATTKAQISKVLDESIAYCDAAYAALDDRRAAEIVNLPFSMGKGARALPLILNTGHFQEHYGNLVTYFRVRGMVPPSSQQK